jgi:ribonuclease HII
MKNYTWKNITEEQASQIKNKLLELGGEERDVSKDQYKKWSIKFYDSIFDYFLSSNGGKIYCNGSKSDNPEVKNIYNFIDELTNNKIEEEFDLYIGLDEAGKGEVAGHLILVSAIVFKGCLEKLGDVLGNADTKKKKSFKYWDDLFKEIDNLKKEGCIDYVIEKISPWIYDKYNVNKIIDITYQRNLAVFNNKYSFSRKKVRLIIDNYGIGVNLRTFLNFLNKNGVEVHELEKADDNFIEVRLASVIAKWQREAVINAINNNKEFEIDGLKVGSGNVGNQESLQWLQEWYRINKSWPWFIKKSFKTIREIEGKPPIENKPHPPFNIDLLSKEFINDFNNGILSITSLSLVCPNCGNILKSAKFNNYINKQTNEHVVGLKCESCAKNIENADFTLRYYIPFILPDANALSRNVLSRDLEIKKFFQDFYIIISDVVFQEIDGTQKGKDELQKLREFDNKGRIKLIYLEKENDVSKMKKQSYEKDSIIIEQCLQQNAIFLTGDKSAAAKAQAKKIFTIFI